MSNYIWSLPENLLADLGETVELVGRVEVHADGVSDKPNALGIEPQIWSHISLKE